jgi:hypothetical protein
MGEGVVDGASGSERCCLYEGCTTRLSVYNSDFLCWTHADVKTRARFERVSSGHPARSEGERYHPARVSARIASASDRSPLVILPAPEPEASTISSS